MTCVHTAMSYESFHTCVTIGTGGGKPGEHRGEYALRLLEHVQPDMDIHPVLRILLVQAEDHADFQECWEASNVWEWLFMMAHNNWKD